jgi:hypothetical protein
MEISRGAFRIYLDMPYLPDTFITKLSPPKNRGVTGRINPSDRQHRSLRGEVPGRGAIVSGKSLF